ncbi:MAG: hypothetical protein J3Q66DRAFT_330832 [Benniella sp.]|nr:MAG: hypothetical protein J3Q66DRAFT_330832 [Benniella sp.]
MSSDQKPPHGLAQASPDSQNEQPVKQDSLPEQSGETKVDNASTATTTANSTATSSAQQPAAQPKAKRKRITPEQLEDLVGLFEKTDTPSFEVREGLAKKLGMTNREIQVWFQNRRAKQNRIKINEQAALQHQQHMQMQQQQQQYQGHHPFQHHRSHSSNGFGGPHPSLMHSSPVAPLQPLQGHHHHPHHQNMSSGQDSSAYGYFAPNGSSSPPMNMPTPTPRAHPHGQPGRRPQSLYNMGSYGLQTQYQQKPGQFQPQHPNAAHYNQQGGHGHSGHGHSNSFSHSSAPYGMDIILPANSSSSTSSSSHNRPILPPPITTMQPRRSGDSMEYEDSRRPHHRHERTMSEGHLAGYMSPHSVSPISPPPERHLDLQYRDEHDEDSPTSATQPSPFSNGGANNTGRHSSASLASFGLKPMVKSEEPEPNVTPRERHPSSAYYNNPTQAAQNRRSYDESVHDDQLMRDNFNMDTRLVITEDDTRPGSAIDLLAYAAAYVQESEEHKKENMDGEDKRDLLAQFAQLGSSNKRQSFHGPTGYPSKEPFQEESGRYSSSGMSWEPSSSGNNTSNNTNNNNSGNDVMPVPRRRGGDDGPYAPRRPRPVTYGGSGYLYDHHENQFMPQSPASSLGSYSRPSSSASRRMSRTSNDMGSGGLLLQRGLTRPRRSSSTATAALMNQGPSPMTVLPPIINENRLLSPAMVPSPQFGASRLARQDSNQGLMSGSTRDSPGSDSYSRDSYNESHTSRDDMEDIEDEEMEYQRQRATKRRSGTASSFFTMSVK